ncbi:MAG: TRAP transporter fused permease subunit [Clostridia bacterium]|nr:TRAP transporter fused permease subunit [Clostridia bacterium]
MSETEARIHGSGTEKAAYVLSVVVAVVLCLFHLLAASPVLTLNNTTQAIVHGSLIIAFFLLVKPLKFKGKHVKAKSTLSRVVDVVLIVLTILVALEAYKMRNTNSAKVSDYQYLICQIFIAVAVIIAYRALGPVLPTLALVFFIYTLVGKYLPEPFRTAPVKMNNFAKYLVVGDEGLFGSALSTAANFIFLFVIFGSMLNFIGAGEFFVDISFAAFGRVCGGPAQAAVYSSMLMGMVNGSGAANVVTTGTFTIPLMKKTGFDKDTAGAVEAVASNGGQIMPPVMGAVAFLMAQATNLPYTTICLAALLPAVLYYLTLSVSIFSYAHKNHIPVQEPDPNAKTVGQIFKEGWYYFSPIVVLIVLMVIGLSTQRAALITIGLCVVIGLMKDPKKFTPKNLMNLCISSAKSIMSVSIACMIAGVIVGAINKTGLGLSISGLITTISGGNIFFMGLLTAFVCIILGMGLPTSACYIVLSVLVAPAMISLGVATISAHMFVLYYGVVAAITPPVALAVFAAIGISGGDMWKTGFQAIKLAISGFVIPFVFLYNTELLCYDVAANTFGFSPMVIFCLVTAAIGCAGMAFGLFGWFKRDLKIWERAALVAGGVMLLVKEPLLLNAAGLLIVGGILVLAAKTVKKEVLTK